MKTRHINVGIHLQKGNSVVLHSDGTLGIVFATTHIVNYKDKKISFWKLTADEKNDYIEKELNAGRFIKTEGEIIEGEELDV